MLLSKHVSTAKHSLVVKLGSQLRHSPTSVLSIGGVYCTPEEGIPYVSTDLIMALMSEVTNCSRFGLAGFTEVALRVSHHSIPKMFDNFVRLTARMTLTVLNDFLLELFEA